MPHSDGQCDICYIEIEYILAKVMFFDLSLDKMKVRKYHILCNF